MKILYAQLILLAAAPAAWTAEPRSDFQAGRREYLEGNFKRAASHFRQAIQADATNVDAYFWLGKSYAVLADIGMPFRSGRSAQAYSCLARAVELAPDRSEYRRELFGFLLDAADYSAAPLTEAAKLMRPLPGGDADRAEMQWRLENEYEELPASRRRPGFFFLTMPQRIDGVVEWPAARLRTRLHPQACGN
jgi:tetratricopeptide (TPR) repeat protein